MNKDKVQLAQSADEAREYAKDWQNWMSDQNMSYGELAEWQLVFRLLAEKYPELGEEFSENGII